MVKPILSKGISVRIIRLDPGCLPSLRVGMCGRIVETIYREAGLCWYGVEVPGVQPAWDPYCVLHDEEIEPVD